MEKKETLCEPLDGLIDASQLETEGTVDDHKERRK